MGRELLGKDGLELSDAHAAAAALAQLLRRRHVHAADAYRLARQHHIVALQGTNEKLKNNKKTG